MKSKLQLAVAIAAILVINGLTFAQEVELKTPTHEPIRLRGRDDSLIKGELWKIEVPENRTKSSTGKISLAVLRVPSPRRSDGEPVFFLAGGPGGPSIEAVKQMIANGGQRFFDLIGGDIVAIDQRGVGLSKPNLSTDVRYGISPTEPGSIEGISARRLQVISSEAERFRQKGIDLSAYNSRESADDIEAVRQALGYDKIVLWGSSYGTHLAMATIRRHEEHIARALLVGPEGPDHTQKLPFDAQRVLERISELASEHDEKFKNPSMIESLEKILDRLEASPVWGEVDGHRVGLSKSDLQAYVAMKLSLFSGSADGLPAEVLAMTNGDFSDVLTFLYEYRQSYGPRSMMALAMDSASSASSQRFKQIQSESKTATLGSRMNSDLISTAKALGIEPLDDQFRSTLKTEVSIQFVVGDLDYRTPVSNARELMKTMPNASLAVVKNCGHADLPLGMPKIRKIWGEFLRSGKGQDATVQGSEIRFKGVASDSDDPDSNDSEFVMTREQMKPMEGRYRFSHGATMKIKAGENCLVATIPGKGDFKFWPLSSLEFEPEIKQLPVLTFTKNDDGDIISVTGNGKVAKKIGRR